MLNRHQWNSYWRADRQSPWCWVGSGAFYSEANGEAMLRTSGGELMTIFGRMLPREYEEKHRRMLP